MKYTIRHKTAYTYLEPVSLCHNIARLVPRNTDEQICKNTSIRIEPLPDKINEYEDFFGNKVIYFSIEKEHWELTVNVTSEVERKDLADSKIKVYRKEGLEETQKEIMNLDSGAVDIKQYLYETVMTSWNEDVLHYSLQSFLPGRPVYEAVEDLTRRIYEDFEYKPG